MAQFNMTPRRGVITPFAVPTALRLKPEVKERSLYPHVFYVSPSAFIMPRLYRNQGYREFIRHGSPETTPETEWYGYVPKDTVLESGYLPLGSKHAWMIPQLAGIEDLDLSNEYSRNPSEQTFFLELDNTGATSAAELGGRPELVEAVGFSGDFATKVHGPKNRLSGLAQPFTGQVPFSGLFRTEHTHYSDFSGLWNDGGVERFFEPSSPMGWFSTPNANTASAYLLPMESNSVLDLLRYVFEFTVVFKIQDDKGSFTEVGTITKIDRYERVFFNDATTRDPEYEKDLNIGAWRETTSSQLLGWTESYSGSGLQFHFYLSAPAYAECYVPNGSVFKGLSSDPMGGVNALYVELFFRIQVDIGLNDPAVAWVIFHSSPVLTVNWAGEAP